MAIKQKVVYLASDGKQFDDEECAAKHEEVVELASEMYPQPWLRSSEEAVEAAEWLLRNYTMIPIK